MELAHDQANGSFRLSEVLAALSHALDLTEGQPAGHAVRTCVLGQPHRRPDRAGRRRPERAVLRAPAEGQRLLVELGAHVEPVRRRRPDPEGRRQAGRLVAPRRGAPVHRPPRRRGPVAAPARRPHAAASPGDLKREGQAIVETRCERGADIARQLELPEAAAVAIRELDEHWDGSGRPYGLTRRDQHRRSHRMRRAERRALPRRPAAATRCAACSVRAADAGSSPMLADALLAIDADDPIWDAFVRGAARAGPAPRSRRTTSSWAPTTHASIGSPRHSPRSSTRSRHTPARHSAGSRCTPARSGASSASVAAVLRDLRRGALLHDLGKLGIPNTILDKPGKLDQRGVRADQDASGLHRADPPRVPAFAPLAAASSAHHERLERQRLPARPRKAASSPRTRACSPWPTCSRRSPRTARTGTACRSIRRSRSCGATRERRCAPRP